MDAELAALPDDVDVLKAALLAARAETAVALAEQSSNRALIAHLKLQIEKLNRDRFGPRSERTARLLDQMELQLEALETTATEDELAAGTAAAKTTTVARFTRARPARRPFPEHLPRERVVVPSPVACACCGSARLSKLGEDVTESLETIPRTWKVIQHVREKFSCRDCERISQPPAPFHVIPRGWAGPNLLAMILFERFGQHQPLNRQAERYGCESVPISLSTLADLVGTCTAVLMPLFYRLQAHVMAAERLHGDDTTVPVLARGKTDIARSGFMCATTSHSADLRRRERCSTTRATAVASIRRATWRGMPGCCRPTPMAVTASFTSPDASQAQSSKRHAGPMHAGSFSCWPTSRAARAGRRRARPQPCCRRSAWRPCSASTPCSTLSATSTAMLPGRAGQPGRLCRHHWSPTCIGGSASNEASWRAATTSPAPPNYLLKR